MGEHLLSVGDLVTLAAMVTAVTVIAVHFDRRITRLEENMKAIIYGLDKLERKVHGS